MIKYFLGGAKKGIGEGTIFPIKPGPYVKYQFNTSAGAVTDKENIYQVYNIITCLLIRIMNVYQKIARPNRIEGNVDVISQYNS